MQSLNLTKLLFIYQLILTLIIIEVLQQKMDIAQNIRILEENLDLQAAQQNASIQPKSQDEKIQKLIDIVQNSPKTIISTLQQSQILKLNVNHSRDTLQYNNKDQQTSNKEIKSNDKIQSEEKIDQQQIKENSSILKLKNQYNQYPLSQANSKKNALKFLSSHRLLRIIFNHFCKQKHLASIKSTLFQDKKHAMEIMSISKWMILNKQFCIQQKLFQLKKKQGQQPIQNSQVKQKTAKIRKIIQKNIVTIFRKGADNTSYMNFHQFCQAIILLLSQFKPYYQESIQGLNKFLSEVFYCANEKDCLQKLSNLKMTSSIPQIEYKSPTQISNNSRVKKNQMFKQNQTQNSKRQIANSMLPHNFQKFTLNPVIRQAKKTMLIASTYSNSMMKKQLKYTKLKPYPAEQKLQKRVQITSELINFFDTSKDPILQDYFQSQKNQKLNK